MEIHIAENISYGARTLNSIVGADHDSGESSRHAKLSMDLSISKTEIEDNGKSVGSSAAGGQLFAVMNFYFRSLIYIVSVGGNSIVFIEVRNRVKKVNGLSIMTVENCHANFSSFCC